MKTLITLLAACLMLSGCNRNFAAGDPWIKPGANGEEYNKVRAECEYEYKKAIAYNSHWMASYDAAQLRSACFEKNGFVRASQVEYRDGQQIVK